MLKPRMAGKLRTHSFEMCELYKEATTLRLLKAFGGKLSINPKQKNENRAETKTVSYDAITDAIPMFYRSFEKESELTKIMTKAAKNVSLQGAQMSLINFHRTQRATVMI